MTQSASILVTPDDSRYPSGLLDLEHPPSFHLRGDLPARPMVAVVGTRRCTRYGIDLAEACGRILADLDWPVVSGLARGIDAAAHRGVVSRGGRGIAILGSGLDFVYPKENAGLLEKLLSLGGGVISEYPDGTPPDRWRFPARNRLIAAMAAAVVVVESGISGGSQITALLAAEIGRPVFAFPGDVDRPASEGTNRLIRDGAIPVFGSEDLVDELSLLQGFEARPRVVVPKVIPAGGVEIGELPGLWDCSIADVLARIGEGEAKGEFRREGDRLYLETGPN